MRKRSLTPVLGMGLLCATAVGAQEADSLGLEEVVVTAQKREQSIQEVPISVTAFSAEDIERNRIRGVADYVEQTPNVSYPDTGEMGFSQVVIRGLQNFGGNVNAFGVYLDEFSLAPSGLQISIDPELQDVDRLEVLRGPQGVAFGRNVIAGAVNITSRKPGNELEGDALIDYGRYNTHLVKAGVSLPLVQDVLAMRVTGFHSESDGFIDDLGPGNNTNDYENYGGRVAFRFTGIDGLTADAAVTLSRKTRGLPSAVPGTDLPPDSLLFGPFFGAEVPLDGGEGRWPQNRDKVSTNLPTEQSVDTNIYQLRLAYDFGSASLVSVTGKIEADYDYYGEADMTAGDYTYIDEVMGLDSFSQELRLQSNSGARLNWLLGVIYSEDESTQLESFGGGVDGWAGINNIVTFVANPARQAQELAPLPSFPLVRSPLNSFGGDTESVSKAAFAEVGYEFTDKFSSMLGVRYTRDRITTDFRRFGDFSPPGLLAGVLEPFYFTAKGETTYDALTPRLTLQYKANDSVNLYVSASEGYKSGGFNAQAAAFAADIDAFDFTYDPEKAWNYEAGIKTQLLDNRLRFNAAVFYIDWKDVQVSAFDLETLSSLTQNAAKATARGVELEMLAMPMRGLTVSAALGYLDATMEEFRNAVVDGDVVDVSGNELPYAPRWSASASAQYETTLGAWPDATGFARIDYSFRDSQYDDIGNRVRDELPSYSLWNLSAGVTKGSWRVAAYIENLFESEYHLSPSDVQDRLPLSGDLVDVHPRIYGVTVSYQY
ncbi:TonB-dependent receptor [Steroidobacter flavus]|uniref:TonB-dependent receptor n=1 Tax=Steroidobacter flavus TaxID=1842136 RepID=A0ABV8SJX7_9GAMM